MTETEARKAWTLANTTRFNLKLQNSTDADIIEHLRKQDSMQGYIKRLIREDMNKSRK